MNEIRHKTTVSVCMLTYNHEKYISQAIESVISQETDFSIEIVIGEDLSTDNTRKICEDYQRKYPEKIKLLSRESNLGVIRNSIETLKSCEGKYTAICEGDDYWTDKLKLQKQVDFLEKNLDYGLVHTDCTNVDETDRLLIKYEPKFTENNKNGDVFNLFLQKKYSIASLTVLFRTQLFKNFEKELASLELKMTDLPMWLEFSKKMKVKYLDEATSAYRHLQNSASHSDNVEKIINFKLNSLLIREYFADKYHVKIHTNKEKSKIYSNILRDCYFFNNNVALNYYFKMLKYNVLSIFNPRPLLFLLGCKYQFFKNIITKIQNSNSNFLKRHFT
mgnify:CR=1 FL=1